MKPRVKRLTRAEKQQETRLALLDAAIELFAEQGVEATSIEEITAQAGYSRGAFYSNFASMDELFLDACRRFLDRIHEAARVGPDELLDRPGHAYADRMRRILTSSGKGSSMFLAEISLYAIRHPALTGAVAEMHQEQLAPAVGFVRTVLATAEADRSPAEVEQLANVMQSLTFGLHLFSLVDPEVDAEACIALAGELMLRGLAAD